MVVFTEEVVRICNEQWEFFDRGRRKEYQKKVFRRVGDFWSEGADVSGRTGRSQVDFGNLDRDNPEVIVPDSRNKNPPWSAAFISFVAKTAGAGNRFKYSGAHATYILAALDAAANSNTTAKFIARRHTQQRPQIGDLIACGRERAKTATFDTVRDFVVEGILSLPLRLRGGNRRFRTHDWRQCRPQRGPQELAAQHPRAYRRQGPAVADRERHLHHRLLLP